MKSSVVFLGGLGTYVYGEAHDLHKLVVLGSVLLILGILAMLVSDISDHS